MANILLIDDDQFFRTMLRIALERAGHQVTEAINGRIGLRLFREKPADLVITDIIMPDTEGLETITSLRHESHDVPVVAVSGGGRLGGDSYLDLAKRFGANTTFAKPLCLKSLCSCVQEFTATSA